MNESSEKLTAQRNGIYSFLFTAFAQFPPSSDVYLGVGLFLNGVVIEWGRADDIGTTSQFEKYSFQSTLNLQKGDEIWLQIGGMSAGAYLFGSGYNHFSGYLLEEKIAIAKGERNLFSH